MTAPPEGRHQGGHMTDPPYWQGDGVTLYHGDAKEVLKQLPNASDVPAAAREAFAAAEAAWYEANGIGIPVHPHVRTALHKLAQDMWAAVLEWAAQQMDAEAERHDAAATTDDGLRLPRPRLDAAARAYEHAASLLRQGGEGGTDVPTE